jgi:translation initiation factor IF-2
MNEQRVTRTVIRRRASATPSTAAEPELAPPVQEPIENQDPVSELQKLEETKLQEARPQPTPPPAAPEPPPPVQTKPTPAPEEDYGAKYKRIKVVGKFPESPPMPEVRRKDTPVGAPGTGEVNTILATPQNFGLGRKEIIEIRDFHRPKTGKRRRITPGKMGKKTEITTPKAIKRVIKLSQEAITVADLAKKMNVKAGDLIKKLIGMGMMVTINQTIDLDTATLVATEFGYEIENVSVAPEDLLQQHESEQAQESPEDLIPRAPVVTVMGHVDHGKTSLLDSIRQTEVAAREAGGITQHIGAYTVRTSNGRTITFIDTPGHEAFTAMRARGAKVTDVVVLVVAGDDGVMPQTKEAINHAKSANVPIIVAVNKMDKPGADAEKVKKALTEFSMVPEEWGGDTLYVPVSAKSGMGVPQLLETLALQTDVLELKANPKKSAKGTVVEAQLDKRRGTVMTVLVQNGTLREGDVIVAGDQFGRVRAMNDDKGKRIREAGPSMAVEILGLSGMVTAGDDFVAVADEKKAKQVSEMRQKISRDSDMAKSSKVSLEDLYSKIEQGDVKGLNVVVKADTSGSVEVLTDTIEKLSNSKVQVKVIHGAVGGITENDIMLASASQALVVGFNVRPDTSARSLAERQKVDIRMYDVIYHLTEDITKAMTGLLAPRKVEQYIGRAEVREVYSIPKVGTVAGTGVVDGKMLRSANIRLIRDGVPVYTGKLSSLKRFKDDAREVAQGLECGMLIENFNDVKVGDIIEAFSVEEVAPTLE